MEIVAVSKSVRVSPRKVRLVADTIAKKKAQDALTILSALPKRASLVLAKTVKSAIANGVHNAKMDASNLVIAQIDVTEGPFLKRYHPSTRGRIHPYKRRSSHIRVVLKEVKPEIKPEEVPAKKEAVKPEVKIKTKGEK